MAAYAYFVISNNALDGWPNREEESNASASVPKKATSSFYAWAPAVIAPRCSSMRKVASIGMSAQAGRLVSSYSISQSAFSSRKRSSRPRLPTWNAMSSC